VQFEVDLMDSAGRHDRAAGLAAQSTVLQTGRGQDPTEIGAYGLVGRDMPQHGQRLLRRPAIALARPTLRVPGPHFRQFRGRIHEAADQFRGAFFGPVGAQRRRSSPGSVFGQAEQAGAVRPEDPVSSLGIEQSADGVDVLPDRR
jgi:hypothetical protein